MGLSKWSLELRWKLKWLQALLIQWQPHYNRDDWEWILAAVCTLEYPPWGCKFLSSTFSGILRRIAATCDDTIHVWFNWNIFMGWRYGMLLVHDIETHSHDTTHQSVHGAPVGHFGGLYRFSILQLQGDQWPNNHWATLGTLVWLAWWCWWGCTGRCQRHETHRVQGVCSFIIHNRGW